MIYLKKLCHSQKEKSEEVGSSKHDATASGEAMVSRVRVNVV